LDEGISGFDRGIADGGAIGTGFEREECLRGNGKARRGWENGGGKIGGG